MALPDRSPQPFVIEEYVRWSDVDFAGIIFYGSYVRLFEIAETDLELRGPGEFFGTKQAGIPSFRVANLLRDRDLLELARREAANTLENQNEVSAEERTRALQHLRSHWQRRYGLVEVG